MPSILSMFTNLSPLSIFYLASHLVIIVGFWLIPILIPIIVVSVVTVIVIGVVTIIVVSIV